MVSFLTYLLQEGEEEADDTSLSPQKKKQKSGMTADFCKSMRNFQRNFLEKKSGQEIVYDLANTGRRFGQYRLAIWQSPFKARY